MKITNLTTQGINTSTLGKYPKIFGPSKFIIVRCLSYDTKDYLTAGVCLTK